MSSKTFVVGSIMNFDNAVYYNDIDFSKYSGDSLIPLVDTMTKQELYEYYVSFCLYFDSKEDVDKDTKMFSFGNNLWEPQTTLEFLDYTFSNSTSIHVDNTKYCSSDLVLFDRQSLVDSESQVPGAFTIGFAVNQSTGTTKLVGPDDQAIRRSILVCINALGLSSHYADYFAGTFTINTDGYGKITIHDIKFGFTTSIVDDILTSITPIFT